MLTDEQLEIISDALIPLFQYLESAVIADVAKRIQGSLSYMRTAELEAENMQRLGYSPARIRREAMKILNADPEFRKMVAKNTLEHKREVKKILREILKSAQRSKKEVLGDAAMLSQISDLHIWKEGGKKLTENSSLSQLVEAIGRQTDDTLENLTGTTGFKTMSGYEAMASLYRRELDKAMIKVCTGTFSQEQVVYDTVHDLANSGLRTIDFSSGRSMQLDTAVKLAVRTGAHQLAGKITDANIQKTGENLVYVSKHWGARNTGTGHANHEQWQGRVYFIKEGTDYSEEAKRIGQDRITSLWYATGYSVDGTKENDPLGLYGYNCRHRLYAWFEGISDLPSEDPEPQPVTINGKTYDYYAISQKMRAKEREIRNLKREREALKALEMDTKEVSVKIKQKIRSYKEFCDVAKVKPDINRLRYECGTSDLSKTEAWKKYRETVFEGDLKDKTLGASDQIGDGGEPIYIGQIDVSKKEQAIEYFGNEIRDSEIEKLYVIDKDGNVYYNEGVEDAVSIGSMDLTDCTVIHNHPKSNGIKSFGEDDFGIMRQYQTASFRLVNEQFDYYAEITKPIDEVTYNQAWRWAIEDMTNVDTDGELQHRIMEGLEKRGYIKYGRKSVVRRKK